MLWLWNLVGRAYREKKKKKKNGGGLNKTADSAVNPSPHQYWRDANLAIEISLIIILVIRELISVITTTAYLTQPTAFVIILQRCACSFNVKNDWVFLGKILNGDAGPHHFLVAIRPDWVTGLGKLRCVKIKGKGTKKCPTRSGIVWNATEDKVYIHRAIAFQTIFHNCTFMLLFIYLIFIRGYFKIIFKIYFSFYLLYQIFRESNVYIHYC